MIKFISDVKKRIVGRNNNCTSPLIFEFDVIENLEFQFVNLKNQILELNPDELQGLSLAIGLKQNDFSHNLLALSQDFVIEDNTLKFKVNTWTKNWLKYIKKNNTEAFIEISQRTLENRRVLLRDTCLVWPRTFTVVDEEPEDIPSNFYTKEEVDELLADITADLNAHIADETAHTTEAEKNYWNAKADISNIPTKTSELENDANYQNAAQVSTAINTAISGKLDNPSGGVAGQVLAKTEDGEEWTNIEHPQQVQADWNEDDTESAAYIQNKPDLSVYAEQTYVDEELAKKADVEDVPSAVSQLENDADYQNATQVSIAITNAISGKADTTYVDTELAKKQDKITAENKLDYALLSGTPEIPSPEWGSISGSIENQTDLKNALDLKADKTDLDDEVETLTNAFQYLNATISGYNGQLQIQPNNEIWYWAPEKVTLYSSTNVIEHTFENGKGILKFANDVTQCLDWFRLIRTITNVSLPDTVTSIEELAFHGCSSLVLTSLPSGITSIGDQAFHGCSSLVLTSLPSGITSIGYQAFRGCSSLALTELPSGITSIGENAFYGCSSLALTELPSGITSIGACAFTDCSSLALTSLPSGITSIEGATFYGCSSLVLTSLPSGITSIGDQAFYNCSNLALTSLPSGITSIGSYTFNNCSHISLTELPSGITSIGTSAFWNCSSLISLTFLGTPTSIYNYAFGLCSNLRDIYVPWSEGEVANAPWGATNATIHYNSVN